MPQTGCILMRAMRVRRADGVIPERTVPRSVPCPWARLLVGTESAIGAGVGIFAWLRSVVKLDGQLAVGLTGSSRRRPRTAVPHSGPPDGPGSHRPLIGLICGGQGGRGPGNDGRRLRRNGDGGYGMRQDVT
jgi:hypothetical protein